MKFPKNHVGRDFIVGDIHGHFELLEKILLIVNFNSKKDRVFATGDIVDRGPFSDDVLIWLRKPWFYSIRGNHEQMAIDAFFGNGDAARHEKNGGKWFYERPIQTQREIVNHFIAMPICLEIQLRDRSRVGVIHAETPNWERGATWDDAIELLTATEHSDALSQALYSRKRLQLLDSRPVEGVTRVYVGHSTVPTPLILGNVIYLDTGCSFSDGRLSMIDLMSQKIVSSH